MCVALCHDHDEPLATQAEPKTHAPSTYQSARVQWPWPSWGETISMEYTTLLPQPACLKPRLPLQLSVLSYTHIPIAATTLTHALPIGKISLRRPATSIAPPINPDPEGLVFELLCFFGPTFPFRLAFLCPSPLAAL